jgi:hypothetical protein
MPEFVEAETGGDAGRLNRIQRRCTISNNKSAPAMWERADCLGMLFKANPSVWYTLRLYLKPLPSLQSTHENSYAF